MTFVRSIVERFHGVVVAYMLGTALAAQPICDVLLRPAFHYTTDGLTVTIADSSSTLGQAAQRMVSFGDGTAASGSMLHTFEQPGTYTVCLTLNTTPLNCSASYCRQITVPMSDCGTINAAFALQPATTNTVSFFDMNIGAFNGQRLWEFGDGTTSDEAAPAHTWLFPGPHFVSLTRTEGQCSATYGTWVEVDGNASTCFPFLFLDFSAEMEGTQGHFTPQVVNNGVVPVLSIWSFGEGTVDTAAVGLNFFPAEGAYQTCLLVGALTPGLDTCFSLVCRTVDITSMVGVNEEAEAVVRAWPNPFTDRVYISTIPALRHTQMLLIDAVGRTVRTQTLNGANTSLVEASGLSTGAYTLLFRSATTEHRVRLLKVD